MREIKFRAWEKELKEMVHVDDISFQWRQINTASAWRHYDEVELMQYTGVKDKNGVEIYEGDVYEDGDSKRHVVTFENGGFGRAGRFLINYQTNESIVTHEPLINDVIDGCEVIGNIHENPELLEVES